MGNQRGLSLVELMIAMALGLILILGVTQIFLGSKRTYTVVTAKSQTQENARVVKHFLGRGLRQAGYWHDSTIPMNFPAVAGFGGNQIVTATNNDSSDAAVLDGTDTITVRFNGTSDGALRGCTGTVPTENQILVDRYYIAPAAGADLVPRLMCQSQLQSIGGAAVSTSTQPLIVGIENLQIEFGLAGSGGVIQYVAADAVTNWSTVRSVRYALLAASSQDTAGEENTRTYDLIGGETATVSGDSRMRQVQRDTVFLRNYRG